MLDDIYKTLLWIAIGIAVIGFLLGWIFPVEGPIDFLYDNYASQPAHRRPQAVTPAVKKSIIIDINDLSEEDFEALQEVFMNR